MRWTPASRPPKIKRLIDENRYLAALRAFSDFDHDFLNTTAHDELVPLDHPRDPHLCRTASPVRSPRFDSPRRTAQGRLGAHDAGRPPRLRNARSPRKTPRSRSGSQAEKAAKNRLGHHPSVLQTLARRHRDLRQAGTRLACAKQQAQDKGSTAAKPTVTPSR